jgi:serine/threonine-protein kinase ULK/ATG1
VIIERFDEELRLLIQFDHPNIMRGIDKLMSLNNYYLILEYCNGGDLARLMDIRKKLDYKFIRVILKQLAQGLKYLEDNNIVHRDLKLDNIMVNFPDYKEKGKVSKKYIKTFNPEDENIEIIIGDLGFAKMTEGNILMKTI